MVLSPFTPVIINHLVIKHLLNLAKSYYNLLHFENISYLNVWILEQNKN